MRRWLGPSLLRRIVLTLVAALALAWVALLLKDYLSFKQDVRSRDSLGRVTAVILDSLQDLDASQARAAMGAADRQYNALQRQSDPDMPGALQFQLSGLDGTLVYRSHASPPLPDLWQTQGQAEVRFAGVSYWPMVREDAHWRLAIWVPVVRDGTALLRIGKDILGYVLLALPIVVFPLLLAVWLGLRPLRRWAQGLAQRAPDDLSDVQEPTGYAELAPVVASFNGLLARARALRSREQAFVQDAAHELKTPLAVVAAQAHVLAHSEDAHSRAQSLQALERGVGRISRQVEQLLALSMLDGAGPVAWERVDATELAREVVLGLAPLAQRQGVEMALEAPETLPVYAEAMALRSILGNLVGNALLHGGSGGRVDIVLRLDGDTVCLEVADKGPGIAPSDYQRVFDRFQRGASPAGSGSGLGLSIVRQAAARMGGTVRLGPGLEGRGLCVCVVWQHAPALE